MKKNENVHLMLIQNCFILCVCFPALNFTEIHANLICTDKFSRRGKMVFFLPIFIIYRYKLIMLTFINPPIIWICAIGSNNGVKMNIFCVTPQVMPVWNISWESSVPFQHISLFLRVNKEGLCDGTNIRGIIFLIISFLWFLEWRKNRH